MFESVVCEHMPKTATARRYVGQKKSIFSRQWVSRETGNRIFIWYGLMRRVDLDRL